MAYTRTGRPPGRPKTKEYVTLMARVPQDIADQAKRHASRHRQTISDVLRDGLDLLLQEERYAPSVSDTHTTPAILSDTIPIDTTPEILSDMNGTPEIMSDTIHHQRRREMVSDMNEDAPEQEIVSDINSTPEIMSDTNGAHSRPLDAADLGESPRGEPVAIAQQSAEPALDYDASKHALGALCANRHDYAGTGQSLRRLNDGECLECQRARAQAARQRKRQAVPVA